MANLTLYKTLADYPNETGINQIAYPLRDSIAIMNPFFGMLFVILIALTSASYYSVIGLTGKGRFFNSLLASSFVVMVISFFLAFAEWITPYHSLFFIGAFVISYALNSYYK